MCSGIQAEDVSLSSNAELHYISSEDLHWIAQAFLLVICCSKPSKLGWVCNACAYQAWRLSIVDTMALLLLSHARNSSSSELSVSGLDPLNDGIDDSASALSADAFLLVIGAGGGVTLLLAD